MTWAAVIVAAGRGTRFGRPKQLLEVAGVPMVAWSIRAFGSMREIGELVIATEREWLEPMRAVAATYAPGRIAAVVEGGSTRQMSSRNGLLAVERGDNVLIHDGARPLVRADDVRAAMREVRAGRGCVLAAPVVDTIKIVDAQTMRVRETPDRTTLWAAQTPQLATRADFLRAFAHADERGIDATDDAALLESIGVEVAVVPSTSENFKVTVPEDLVRVETLLRGRTPVGESA